jgi:hypothetical protein
VPGAFQELQHQHPHPIAHGAQSRPHGSGRLAFAGAGVDQNQSASRIGHHSYQLSAYSFQQAVDR